ncbi:hypothetical protein [Micromonospora sp. NPDC050695]|uniref:hypothetical protein n=1 Tax=Micromonospora sp. NPDC050695 TaxID=3154938 RepID=UPI0033CAD08D
MLSRVRLTVDGLVDGFTVRVERSTNQVSWTTVRGGAALNPVGGVVRLDDYEFAPNIANWYRVVGPSPADGFTRVASNGWGTPNFGPTWVETGTASAYSTNGTAAVHTHTVRAVTLESRQDVSLANFDITLRGITASATPTGADNNTTVTIAGRQVANDRVEARLFYNVDGTITVNARQVVGGIETLSAFPVVSGAVATSAISLRLRAAGSSVQAWAWLTSAPDPAQPSVSMTATWTATGLLRVRSVLAAGTTNTLPFTFSYDSFAVTSPEVTLFAGTITPVIDGVWLKSLARPFLNRQVVVRDYSEITRRSRAGVFDVKGRSMPVAVTDVRGSRQWALDVNTYTEQERSDLDLLLAAGDILFVHVPPDAGRLSATPGGYVAVGDSREATPPTAELVWRVFSLPLTEVAAPGPDVVGATTSCQGLLNVYTSCAAVLTAHPTCASVLELIGSPSDVIVD